MSRDYIELAEKCIDRSGINPEDKDDQMMLAWIYATLAVADQLRRLPLGGS